MSTPTGTPWRRTNEADRTRGHAEWMIIPVIKILLGRMEGVGQVKVSEKEGGKGKGDVLRKKSEHAFFSWAL